jgi:hypothetical protein
VYKNIFSRGKRRLGRAIFRFRIIRRLRGARRLIEAARPFLPGAGKTTKAVRLGEGRPLSARREARAEGLILLDWQEFYPECKAEKPRISINI